MEIDVPFFEKLLRIKSVSSDAAATDRAVDCLREWLEARGVLCTVEKTGDRNILFASTVPGKTPDYLFNAHLDVVPADDDAFEPRIDADGVIHGRGVHDCKGGAMAIASMLAAVGPRASVGAAFTTDEETGGSTAAAAVELGYGAKKAVIIVDSAPYAIATAQKGIANYVLRAHGHGGHSSRPWEFDNAIDKLIDGYSRFRAVWPKLPEDIGNGWFDTASATIVHAGTVHNRIPDTAEMTINLRYIKRGDPERVAEILRETTGLEVEMHVECPPVFSDESNPELQRLAGVMRRHWPDRDIRFYLMMGATDARHFESLGVPIANLGVDGGGDHETDERLRLASIGEMADMLTDFVTAK